MFNNNSDQDEDSKRMQEIIGRNQTRNMGPSFSSETDSEETDEQTETPSFMGGDDKTAKAMSAQLFHISPLKMKIYLACAGAVFFLFIVFLSVIGSSASGEGDREISKDAIISLGTIGYEHVNNANSIFKSSYSDRSSKLWKSKPFEEYFDAKIKSDLIEYLVENRHCERSTCESSDAYKYFKQFLKVTDAFAQKGYPMDTGLVYETIGYYRSDEEIYDQTAKDAEKTGINGIVTSLFDDKNTEISKLATNQWLHHHEVYDTDDGSSTIDEFIRSLDKYVAYLMFGDTLDVQSDIYFNDDISISGGSDGKNYFANESTSKKEKGTHSYKYGTCTPSDRMFAGDVKQGYIYQKYKNTQLKNVKDENLSSEIQSIIQNIFDQTIRMYGAPSYCGGYSSGSYRASCMWWPIGSDKTTTEKGITYASEEPATTKITSSFGTRNTGIVGASTNHQAIDIGGGVEGKTNVIAAADGEVIATNFGCVAGDSTCGGRLGNFVKIKHKNGVITRYGHLYIVTVSVGDEVKQGQVIGKMGNTGTSSGPHLDFQVIVNGEKVDPLEHVSQTATRPNCSNYEGKTNKDFFEFMAPFAITDMHSSGILASITLAQAALESGYGKSGLAKKYNNFFGVKAGSNWTGEKVALETWEQDKAGNKYKIVAYFRVYPSVQDSIADHSKVLSNRTYYDGAIGETDYRKAIKIIAKHYATDIHYADKVCKIIETYNLAIYDSQ